MKLKLYNFKVWNWTDKGERNGYTKAAVFATNRIKAKMQIRNWLPNYDEYFLFEVIP